MARWVWPTATGVVTSATGVAINLATDGANNPWTWAAVVLLTGLGAVIAGWAQPSAAPAGVHNSITEPVNGPVIQVGYLGTYTDNSVNQTATAHGDSTIHQAGRDVTGS
jgi:hypothetical protein